MATGLSARGHTSRSRDFRFFSLASVMSVRKNHAHARLALFCVCVIKEKRERCVYSSNGSSSLFLVVIW